MSQSLVGHQGIGHRQAGEVRELLPLLDDGRQGSLGDRRFHKPVAIKLLPRQGYEQGIFTDISTIRGYFCYLLIVERQRHILQGSLNGGCQGSQ